MAPDIFVGSTKCLCKPKYGLCAALAEMLLELGYHVSCACQSN